MIEAGAIFGLIVLGCIALLLLMIAFGLLTGLDP